CARGIYYGSSSNYFDFW
nr:immunoglobulin heavy chain junction region [Mus musculus]MBK4186615.1 immunoglobulin heavy chain junction region [Mus musculus]